MTPSAGRSGSNRRLSAKERARRMVHLENQGMDYFSVKIAGFHIGTYEGREGATEQADRLRMYLETNIEAAIDSTPRTRSKKPEASP